MTRDELTKRVGFAEYKYKGCVWPHSFVHIGKALDLIEKLIVEGEKTHEPMDWKDLGALGNMEHFAEHESHLSDDGMRNISDSKEDHLLNAACRLLMALQLREESHG